MMAKKQQGAASSFETIMRGIVGTPPKEVAAEQKKYEARKATKRKPKR